ncbi:hypothetical protein E2C01_099633 [Portunus trituberculatus]|uniref:Uncharacterized protein n=1 Tax=Portunus trituberculatus TaxID=210409 RepID=A0A5B7K4B8_PORTR|nr:hypothetical protein [Portunus trituberculatus]
MTRAQSHAPHVFFTPAAIKYKTHHWYLLP